jgi:hypothetical protein
MEGIGVGDGCPGDTKGIMGEKYEAVAANGAEWIGSET